MRSSGGSMRSGTAAARWRTISSTPTARAASTGASSCAAAPCSACRCGTIGFLASACGIGRRGRRRGRRRARTSSRQAVQKGGKVTAAINSPAGAIDPITVADDGGLAVLGQAGEYLVWSDSELNAVPRLAESWTPNDDASVWTFKIRQGVKFHDGKEMTAEDVAASINRLADPDNASAGALRLHAASSPRTAPRRPTRRRSSSRSRRPNGSLPVPAELGQLQHDHPARRLRRRLREEHERHGPVHPREVHAGPGRDVPEEPRLLGPGAPAEPGQHGDPLLRQGAGPRARPAVGRGRRGHAVLRLRRPRAAHRPERADGRR